MTGVYYARVHASSSRCGTTLASNEVRVAGGYTPESFVACQSEPDDPIGQGQSIRLVSSPDHVVGKRFPLYDWLTIEAVPKIDWQQRWLFDIGPSAAQRVLTPGTYENVTKWLGYPNQLTSPGMHFYMRGRECRSVSGRFVIHELRMTGEHISRFHATSSSDATGRAASSWVRSSWWRSSKQSGGPSPHR